MQKPSVICLMGPTASGKTKLAIEFASQFSCEIISVDSAMVYRGMDIGTAKPDKNILSVMPHKLIDILDPTQAYSAGQFQKDALLEIDNIIARGKTPLLVGGTMLYFKVLQQGIADLPKANATIRVELQNHAQKHGINSLHTWLAKVDEKAAAQIKPNDKQRLQRALEIFLLTGKTITHWHAENLQRSTKYKFHSFALRPTDKQTLHARITKRFDIMLSQGLLDEVQVLYQRGDLSTALPAIRCVGYRQAWDYLAGLTTFDNMREKAIIATRQLAKRQMTWLNAWPQLQWVEPAEFLNKWLVDYNAKTSNPPN